MAPMGRKAKYESPVRQAARFKDRGEISITVRSTQLGNGISVVWLTYANARELTSYLRDMMEGDLVEVREKDCGCLERIGKNV